MQNETNFSDKNINSLLSKLANNGTGNEGGVSSLKKMLSDDQISLFNSIMSDPQKLKETLSSPEAAALLKTLGKKPPSV